MDLLGQNATAKTPLYQILHWFVYQTLQSLWTLILGTHTRPSGSKSLVKMILQRDLLRWMDLPSKLRAWQKGFPRLSWVVSGMVMCFNLTQFVTVCLLTLNCECKIVWLSLGTLRYASGRRRRVKSLNRLVSTESANHSEDRGTEVSEQFNHLMWFSVHFWSCMQITSSFLSANIWILISKSETWCSIYVETGYSIWIPCSTFLALGDYSALDPKDYGHDIFGLRFTLAVPCTDV